MRRMSKVIILCVVIQLAPVSALFGFGSLWDWLKLPDPEPVIVPDEMHMNASELATSKGFPYETHSVTTEDGYILQLHRIPHGRYNKNFIGSRPVALLQHGLLNSANIWMLNSPDQSLPFLLADAGVDVWLGNNRGNTYSKKHITLDPGQNAFWDFCWDEMAKYDLPAEINYILSQTGNDQLYYVGYSQGTAIGFAKFSEDQELAKKVKHFLALAPVAHVGFMTSALRLLVPFSGEIQTFLNIFGGGAVDADPRKVRKLSNLMYSGMDDDQKMQGLSSIVGDMNGRSINKSKIDVYNAQCVSSTSAKTLMQWAQGIKSNQFQHFDYGANENHWKYGQRKPPLYYPSNIKVPVAIFTGGKDTLSDPTDVSWLLSQINVTHHVNVPWHNHLGLVIGYDAKYFVYPTLISIITGRTWKPDK
ncbi:hypothetical protein RRG08_042427 [Elysia crispata]|uniref:Lipase n=1 Tax=Elysia crispata TaxID=231223 RepID=A0AAE1DDF5_9GAST|nr:hypothetical protein RRG08_042427 [Elysia crispata]